MFRNFLGVMRILVFDNSDIGCVVQVLILFILGVVVRFMFMLIVIWLMILFGLFVFFSKIFVILLLFSKMLLGYFRENCVFCLVMLFNVLCSVKVVMKLCFVILLVCVVGCIIKDLVKLFLGWFQICFCCLWFVVCFRFKIYVGFVRLVVICVVLVLVLLIFVKICCLYFLG